jgi:hypothetical protein
MRKKWMKLFYQQRTIYNKIKVKVVLEHAITVALEHAIKVALEQAIKPRGGVEL